MGRWILSQRTTREAPSSLTRDAGAVSLCHPFQVELSRVKRAHHENRVETGAVSKRPSPLLPAGGDFHPVPGALPFHAGMSRTTPRQPPGPLPASIVHAASRGPRWGPLHGAPHARHCVQESSGAPPAFSKPSIRPQAEGPRASVLQIYNP